MPKLMKLADVIGDNPAGGEHVLLEGQQVRSPLTGTVCLVMETGRFVLIPEEAILGATPLRDEHIGLFVKDGASLWDCRSSDALTVAGRKWYRVDEEALAPPVVKFRNSDPKEWSKASKKKLSAGKTLEGACKAFVRKCDGGGSYLNNCAHYLSNAFIKAGFSELNTSLDCVTARCNEDQKCDLGAYLNHRVIRAKDLRCWFASKANTKATTVNKNSGFWATYQEKPSNGQGHVAIIDTGTWTYYGTTWLSDWKQEYYQW